MQVRSLGNTGMSVSCLGFDTTPLQGTEFNDAQRILAEAYYSGVTLYSTGKGDADSEIKLGYGLNLRRHDVAVMAHTREREAGRVGRAIERSIRNLHTDYIDVYQLRHLDEEEEIQLAQGGDGAIEVLRKAKESGKIRSTSASSFRPAILEAIIASQQVEVVECPVNIFDLDFVERILPLAEEKGVGVVGVLPFAGGVFGDPTMALRFTLDQRVSTVLAGMHSVDHVRQNSSAALAFRPLSGGERQELFEAARHLGREFCRFCGKCLPCPKGIEIPTVLEILRASWRFHRRGWAAKSYHALEVSPSECNRCGECEDRCPYDVNVVSLLERAAHHFA